MGEPMTEAEARHSLVEGASSDIYDVVETATTDMLTLKPPATIAAECNRGASAILDAILATTDALAVLLDPETMLRAWEKAGRVESPGWWFVGPQDDLGTDNPYERFVWVGDVTDEEPLNPAFADRCIPLWRIVPDEEGARDG